MTASEKDTAMATGNENSIVRRMLSSMLGYWMFLLTISFGIAAVIYWVWLRGTV
jgi:phosphate/sulfate permease